MKALILDSTPAGDTAGERLLSALRGELQSRGWEAEHVLLREKKVGNCAGDFFCFIRTPGVCNIDDDNRRIARAVLACDALVYLTPVRFGGYSSLLKCTVDHLTQNLLPFFTRVDGEIFHELRYAHSPKLFVLGWLEAPDPQAEAIFHHLAQRNAINMRFASVVSGVVHACQPDGELAIKMKTWVGSLASGLSSQPQNLPQIKNSISEGIPFRRALLLVGSPRGKKSSSYALGSYLLVQLEAQGVQTETIYLYPALGSRERTQSLLEAVDAHDLIVLAFPLYVDNLPGPVIRSLELIAARCDGKPVRQAFAAIVNSGFPEASHNQTALAICAKFAGQAGFAWAGGLALGAGEAIVGGKPLEELSWRGRTIRASLDLAAQSLAIGNSIPAEAVALMAKERLPKRLFFILGNFGWKQRARKYGVQKSLRRQPYLT